MNLPLATTAGDGEIGVRAGPKIAEATLNSGLRHDGLAYAPGQDCGGILKIVRVGKTKSCRSR